MLYRIYGRPLAEFSGTNRVRHAFRLNIARVRNIVEKSIVYQFLRLHLKIPRLPQHFNSSFHFKSESRISFDKLVEFLHIL